MIHAAHHLTCPVPGSGPHGGALYGTPPWGCTGPVHWLIHGMGIDTQISYFYDFASGFGPLLVGLAGWFAVIATAVAWYRHWDCHATRLCLRHAKHPLTDPDTGETHNLCWKHHPGQRHKHWKQHHIEDVWRRLEHKRRPA